MKKYKIELTEEQFSYISRALRVSTLQRYHIHGERLHKELLALMNEAKPTQEKEPILVEAIGGYGKASTKE